MEENTYIKKGNKRINLLFLSYYIRTSYYTDKNKENKTRTIRNYDKSNLKEKTLVQKSTLVCLKEFLVSH